MQVYYQNKKVEKVCTCLKSARREYAEKIAKRLLKTVNFLESATSLDDVINHRPFYFHDLKGNRDGQYAIDVATRRDGYRLILLFKESKEEVFSNAIEITEVIIKEVTNHYD